MQYIVVCESITGTIQKQAEFLFHINLVMQTCLKRSRDDIMTLYYHMHLRCLMPQLKRKLVLYASQEIIAKSYNLITKKFLRLIMERFFG